MPARIPQYRPAWQAPAGKSRHTQYNEHGRDRELLKLYGGVAWKDFRAMIRRDRVLCEQCKAEGRVVVGSHVHHLVDPRVAPERTFDESNVRLLCPGCHSRLHAKGRRKP